MSQCRSGVKVGLINWIHCGINVNHPVVADGHLFLRSNKHLYCIDEATAGAR